MSAGGRGEGDSLSPVSGESGVAAGVAEPRVREAYASRPTTPFLFVQDVMVRLDCSERTVHELTRTLAIPHRKLPGAKRLLFLLSELEAWEDGAELEVIQRARGGRVVRPKGSHRG